MSGEGQLPDRREDAHPRVPVSLGGEDEGGLGEVDLARELLHQLLGQAPRIREHGQLVSGQRPVREHVADDVAVALHVPTVCREAS